MTGTQRYEPIQRIDEDVLTRAIIALTTQYGRYGYRRITALLRGAAWRDGSCVQLRPERANHVWSYDFVSAMTHDGRTLWMLVLIDEHTGECLAIRVARRLGSYEVIETLADVMLWRGIPENIRSDNGPEFVAKELQKWLANLDTALYIEPGSP